MGKSTREKAVATVFFKKIGSAKTGMEGGVS